MTLPSAVAEGFKNAVAYETHRPSYPAEAVQTLLDGLNLSGASGACIVELGAGAGKFTELLVARPEGYLVIAVEPLAEMRERLAGKALTGVTAHNGHAANVAGVQDGWAAAVIAAQAFHWFANMNTLCEVHRLLKPGGGFGMIWNVEEYNQPRDWPAKTRWAKELNDINFSIDDGHNRFRSGLQWMEVFEEQAKAEGGTQSDNHGRRRLFEYPLKDAKIPWTVWLSEEALWERYATLSHISRLEGAARDNVVRAFKDIMKGEDVERNELGQVAVHGNTYLAWTLRL